MYKTTYSFFGILLPYKGAVCKYKERDSSRVSFYKISVKLKFILYLIWKQKPHGRRKDLKSSCFFKARRINLNCFSGQCMSWCLHCYYIYTQKRKKTHTQPFYKKKHSCLIISYFSVLLKKATNWLHTTHLSSSSSNTEHRAIVRRNISKTTSQETHKNV